MPQEIIEYFEEIFYYLVEKGNKKFGRYNLIKYIPSLRIIDSSVILTALKLAPSIKIDDERAAIKISTMFNGEYPEKINIVSGQTNDRKCIDGMFDNKDCIYVFDRGYYDYRWYDMMSQNGFKFVTRAIKTTIIMEEKLLDSNIDKDIYDTEYKNHWEIELFFLWIKQNLRIKKFIGYNENAVRIQVFTSLISYMLIYIFCKKDNFKIKYNMLILTRIIRVNLLEIYFEGLLDYSS